MSEAPVAEPAPKLRAPGVFGTSAERELGALRAVALRCRPRPSLLAAPITALEGVGPRLAEWAAELGIVTIDDLLRHVPRGYQDRAQIRTIAELAYGEEATVGVEVRSAHVRPTRKPRLRILEATVVDASGSMKATWFNQAYLADRLTPGTRVLLNGKLERRGFQVAAHEAISADKTSPASGTGIHTTGLVAMHPASQRLKAQRIREWTWQAVEAAPLAIEPLPAELRTRKGFPGIADALRAVHFPRDLAEARLARERLAFEELLLHQLALALRRGARRASRPGIEIGPAAPGGLAERWLASLPFQPTADQRAALADLDRELAGGEPMQRLLMGEVGSGKTVVAVYAMLRALEADHQAALMAPTETLAEQHAVTLDRLLAAEAVPFALLTGATTVARRRETLARLASGELGLVVGTHALIESDVEFSSLALCVVDEQHRFGVSQRAALDAKGPGAAAPHVLHMTATPIPRTLSLTAYGDLDTTTIHELPAGRRPVQTWVVGAEKRAGAYGYIRDRLREGRQAYVVCPLVEDSEKLEAKAAGAEAERLARGELAEFTVGLLHGQMPSRDKAAAMVAFVAGDTDVLVATTVIEVGIDVPNATVMLIEGAERFGLSQLHQLRGRVGRGSHESQCILFADPESELARRRMQAIASSQDGFELAEVDLALRGEGEILGTRQSGLPSFRVAVLPDDSKLLLDARHEVLALLRAGDLSRPELGPLLATARSRFGDERSERFAA